MSFSACNMHSNPQQGVVTMKLNLEVFFDNIVDKRNCILKVAF